MKIFKALRKIKIYKVRRKYRKNKSIIIKDVNLQLVSDILI